MSLIKVKPWGKGQGDFVLIEESDFDESKHELLNEKPAKRAKNSKSKEA